MSPCYVAGRKVTLESPHRALAPSKLVLCLVGCRQGLKDSPARCTAVLSRGVRSNCTVNFRALNIALYCIYSLLSSRGIIHYDINLIYTNISESTFLPVQVFPLSYHHAAQTVSIVRVFIVTGRQIIIWGYDVKIRR